MGQEPGPFLMSTPLPIDQLGDRSAILVADLSRYNPASVQQLIAEYEQRIQGGTSDAVAMFNPLKVRLLSAAQYANADIEIELVQLAKLDAGAKGGGE